MKVLIELIGAIIAFLVYFIPTYIAFKRAHGKRWILFLLNFFLGGTVIVWIIVLLWAIMGEPEQETL